VISPSVTLVVDDHDEASVATLRYFKERHWGDGLPVIAPTRDRVDAMMASQSLAPDHVVTILPPTESDATIELIAANAVMAGCEPAHFPVVVAAVEAAGDPKFNLQAINTTTNPVAPMMIVNGPVRIELDLNCSWNVLGPTYQANGVIGRALSLCMMNIAGRTPGVICKGTYKTPGAYTMCAAEYEEESPWEPLHVEHGFRADQSVVTLLGVAGDCNLIDVWSTDAEELATCLANMVSVQQGANLYNLGRGEVGLMLSPGHAKLLAGAFPKKSDLKVFLHDHARVAHGWVTPGMVEKLKHRGEYRDDERGVFVTGHPEQWLIFVAGGGGGYHSAYFHTIGLGFAVSRAVAA